ncbi:hypothetical protein [Nocardioides daphniae]|uniref:hypothetical protein n=1 Tax=Nocardioides daphniae TaxID=402297 RepID=UPI0013156BBC|nr:hypothetical protein [Nocardioides daphniae]
MSNGQIGSSLGLTEETERFYREVMGADGSRVEQAAALLLITVEEFEEKLQPLVDMV